MKTIYKYTLKITDKQTIISAGIIRIVHVAPILIQDPSRLDTPSPLLERINIWALVDTEMKHDTTVSVHGTGHPVDEDERYQGTAVMPSGLVWHVFIWGAGT